MNQTPHSTAGMQALRQNAQALHTCPWAPSLRPLLAQAALAVSPDTVGEPIAPTNPGGMCSEAIGPERELIVYFGKWAEPQRQVVIYAVVF